MAHRDGMRLVVSNRRFSGTKQSDYSTYRETRAVAKNLALSLSVCSVSTLVSFRGDVSSKPISDWAWTKVPYLPGKG